MVVFTTGSDPIEHGLVASLNRPGGNVTGVTTLNVEVAPKRRELARELVPTATVIGVLVNPTNPNTEIELRRLRSAARTLGVQLQVLHASSERDFDAVFATWPQLQAGVLVISGSDTFLVSRSEQLAALTIRHAVPSIFQFREFTAAGGLMSYGGSITNTFIRSKATCAALLCEVLSPCRGRRPHHVQRDRIGTWEVSCLTAGVA